jgi:sugar lactone lactonase YvrE
MNRRRNVLVLVVLAALGWLLAWPVPIDPVAWDPPPAPVLAPDERLRAIERIAASDLAGPEYIEIDAAGRLVTGYAGGALMRYASDGSEPRRIADTGGRPVGLRALRDGTLIVADAEHGLLRVAPSGAIEVLADGHDGVRFGLTDDVAVSADESVAYFTDASAKFGLDATYSDILEHGANGRLLKIDLGTRATTLLADGLHFANGVVLEPGERTLLVCETGSYRVLRVHLAGARAGTREVFADNLPGFPDNITWNGRDRYWVALFNPRNALLDRLGPHPFLRRVVARLPQWLRPQPVRHALAVALDRDGHLVDTLQYAGEGTYAPVTTVREAGRALYFGSLSEPAIGRLPLP